MVILESQIKQVLHLKGDDITLYCHSERSEESRKISLNNYSLDSSLRSE